MNTIDCFFCLSNDRISLTDFDGITNNKAPASSQRLCLFIGRWIQGLKFFYLFFCKVRCLDDDVNRHA